MSKRLMLFFAAVAVMVLTVCIYVYQLRHVVLIQAIQTMRELSSHDIKMTEGLVERTWDDLNRVARQLEEAVTLDDANDALAHIASVFDAMYLLDEQETGEETGEGDSQIDKIAMTARGETTPFVERYVEDGRVSLLYGVAMQGGVLTGLRKIGVVRDQMRIESFGGRGYSSIIDMNGQYIVSRKTTDVVDAAETFFDYIGRMRSTGGIERSEIQRRMTAGETIYLTVTDEEGKRQSIFLMPMSKTAWYFIMTVPYSVFREQSSVYIVMSAVMLTVMMSVIAVLLTMLFKARQKEVKAREAVQARSDFLSNMSHEIRTPLNALIGLGHLMELHIDDVARLKEHLAKFGETSQYLLTLVNDILDMSKLQAGKMEVEQAAMNIDDLFEQVYNMQRDNMMTRDIYFTKDKNIYWKWIIGDKIRVMQVLMNLLSNAAKFTPANGTVRFAIIQDTLADGRMETIFEVADTGCGIRPEFQKHIFESFTQERDTQTASNKGTGLGLAISYELVKRMGGSLAVQSKVGHGSKFTMTLPTKLSHGEEKSATDKVESVRQGTNGVLNILIAEDNDLNAEILAEILQAKGFTSKRASNGAEAVSMFMASKLGEFNVILMDVQMPVMNGYKAALTIRGLPRADAAVVPIFACTANTFKEDRDRAYENGMTDFLAKPIDIDEMMRKLGGGKRI